MARASFCGSRFRQALSVLVAAVILTALAPGAAAHPGHGLTPDGDHAAHYLLEPAHGLGIVILLVLAIAAAAMLRLRAAARSAP